MGPVRDFAANLARGGADASKILGEIEAAFPDETMSPQNVNLIIKTVKAGLETADQRGLNTPKRARTADAIAAVEAVLLDDRRSTRDQIEAETGLSHANIQRILTDDLKMVKKSARWIPRLLSPDQMQRRLAASEDFLRRYRRGGAGFLASIVTMDESAVAFSPETKAQSKQWLPKGTPGPLKARVQASRKKQMVFAFFDSAGLIYQHYAPLGSKINSDYLIEVLGKFLKTFKKKRGPKAAEDWFLHWDNSPLHTAWVTAAFLAKKGIRTLEHPPYSPDLGPADFVLFPTVKAALSGIMILGQTIKAGWERVCGGITEEAFATAFERWVHRFEKCIHLEGGYVEKNE